MIGSVSFAAAQSGGASATMSGATDDRVTPFVDLVGYTGDFANGNDDSAMRIVVFAVANADFANAQGAL